MFSAQCFKQYHQWFTIFLAICAEMEFQNELWGNFTSCPNMSFKIEYRIFEVNPYFLSLHARIIWFSVCDPACTKYIEFSKMHAFNFSIFTERSPPPITTNPARLRVGSLKSNDGGHVLVLIEFCSLQWLQPSNCFSTEQPSAKMLSLFFHFCPSFSIWTPQIVRRWNPCVKMSVIYDNFYQTRSICSWNQSRYDSFNVNNYWSGASRPNRWKIRVA